MNMMLANKASVPAFSVSLSPSYLYTSGAGTPLTSAVVTATPSGGTGPFTYAWTRLSGSASVTATAPTSPSTAFGSGALGVSSARTADWRCTVTDSLAATTSADITTDFERF